MSQKVCNTNIESFRRSAVTARFRCTYRSSYRGKRNALEEGISKITCVRHRFKMNIPSFTPGPEKGADAVVRGPEEVPLSCPSLFTGALPVKA